MERALQGAPFTSRVTFYVGSTGTNPSPDTATIEVVRANGLVLVTAGTATLNDTVTGNGVFAFTFTPVQLAELDVLELRWTATVSGQLTTLKTYLEVAGGFLCTLAAIKDKFPTKTDSELADIRTAAEERLENACRRAFVPRLEVETRSYRTRLRLSWPNVRVIRFASVSGVALSSNQISNLNLTVGGLVLGLPGPSTIGYSKITVGYEHGEDYPDEVIREGVVLVAEETFTEDSQEALVVRREADNQSVSFATPSSSGTFRHPLLRRIVRDYAGPLVA